jgi:hypothetical protein
MRRVSSGLKTPAPDIGQRPVWQEKRGLWSRRAPGGRRAAIEPALASRVPIDMGTKSEQYLRVVKF